MGLCWSLFRYALLYVFSSFAIILTRKRDLDVLLLLSLGVLFMALTWLKVPWVGLQFVIVVFPNHTNLLFSA